MDTVYLDFSKALKGFCHPQYPPGEQAAHVLDEFTLCKKKKKKCSLGVPHLGPGCW